jgi:hypothetical protein
MGPVDSRSVEQCHLSTDEQLSASISCVGNAAEDPVGLRFILATIWLLPLVASAGLLYYEFMIPATSLPETNRAMRTRMCQEHADLARSEPANNTARVAVEECVVSGYLTQTEGLTAID